MNERKQIELEYIYITIPAEYICVYHRILALLADYGEEMLKDCKANCTKRNSSVIECFNMFNSAVAARKLGKTKLAEVIIKYVKAKINQLYKGFDNSTNFVFPVDETGNLKAFVSCGENPKFEIDPDDGYLYEHKFKNGFNEHFRLGLEDDEGEGVDTIPKGLVVDLVPLYENINGEIHPCAEVKIWYNGNPVDVNDVTYQYYFDDNAVVRFNDISNLSTGIHNFKIVVTYNGETKIKSVDKEYEA